MRKAPKKPPHVPRDLALEQAAREAQARAYAPYSHFKVGAALRTEGGAIYCGVNVENKSYGLTVCAERNAIAQAAAAGDLAIVGLVVASDARPPAAPCGACREVLAEFARDLPITLIGAGRARRQTRLAALLPERFLGAGSRRR